jgi:hypothetical protein
MNLESLIGKPYLSSYCPDTCIQFLTVEISIRSHRRRGVRTAEAKKLRSSAEEVLKREIFFTLREAQVLIEQWRREYNTIRPHSSLGYRPPAPEAIRPDHAFLNLPALRGPHPQSQGALN